MKFILIFILTLLTLILVHEFGHYWVARWLNIKVLRFSIGFGRPLWRWFDTKGTEFVLAWGLLGGYVKLLDEREGPVAEQDLPYAFNRQSIAKRAAVIAAGPMINILFGFVMYYCVFCIGIIRPIPLIGEILPHSIAAQALMKPQGEITKIDGKSVDNWRDVAIELLTSYKRKTILALEIKSPNDTFNHYHLNLAHWQLDKLHPDLLTSLGLQPYLPLRPMNIIQVVPDSPAAKAGIQSKDTLLTIEGQPIKDPLMLKQSLEQKVGKTINMTLSRQSKHFERTVTIGTKTLWYGATKPELGIVLAPATWPSDKLRLHKASILKSWDLALSATLKASVINIIIIKKLLLHDISIHSLGGPISIFEGTADAVKQGFVYYLDFIALLSLSLAIFNVLPIPGLDGAQLLFLGIESLRKKPLSIEMQVLLFRLGMIALAVLMVQTFMNDILRQLG